MKRTRLLLTAVVCVFLIGSAVGQITIHVPADRSTIQSAIDSAVNGDTVLVAPGTYHERIDFKGKNITVASEAGAATTIIDGDSLDTVVVFQSTETNAAVLQGFTITHGKNVMTAAHWTDAGGIEIDGGSPTIINNIITDNQGCQGIGIYSSHGSPIIKNNTITNNLQTTCSGGTSGGGIALNSPGNSAQIIGNTITGNSIREGWGGGISVGYDGTPLIQSNFISKNIAGVGGGIQFFNGSSPRIIQNLITENVGGGVDWSGGPTAFVNNTIANNDRLVGSAIYVSGLPSTAIIANNLLIAKDGQTAVYCHPQTGPNPPQISFNDIFSTGSLFAGGCADLIGSRSNISVDPEFANSAAGNYHLSASSPALDNADGRIAFLPITDLDNYPRLVDGGSGSAKLDLGAYEYQGLTTMEVSPAALQFGSIKVNTAGAPQSVLVKNTGTLPLHITTAPVGVDFSQTNNCELPNGLPPNATCSYAVTFLPKSAGEKSENLVVTGANVSSSSSVELAGTGAAPVALLSTTSLDLGTQMRFHGPSAAQIVILTNIGDAPLLVSSVTVAGDYAQTNNCASLAPNASCRISVTFIPNAPGLRTGALTVADNATGSPRQVSLTGVGLGPEISFNTWGLDFGLQRIGKLSNPQIVTVTNPGTYDVHIDRIGISPEFSQTNDCPKTLTPGSSCTVSVRFTPSDYGSRSGSLTFWDDAQWDAQGVVLSGIGSQPIASLSTATVSFPFQYAVGYSSQPMTVSYGNLGNDLLAVQSISTTGDFTQTNQCSLYLQPQRSCSIQITFVPTAAGTRTGTLTIKDDANGSPRNISLQGVALSQYSVPVVTGISPEAVKAGDSTVVTVAGSNFFTLSQVYWDDQPLPTTYQNGISLLATVPGSLANGMGEHKISVITPAPGGGQSNSVPVAVFISVPISAKDLVFDPNRSIFYATIPANGVSYPNTLATLDPDTGNVVGTPLSIGNDPSALAISDDGRYLYVGLNGSSSIKRVDLDTNQVDLTIPLGSDPFLGPYTVLNLAVVPGQPHSVVAVLGLTGVSPYEAGIKVFDEGVARPNSIQGGAAIEAIAFANDTSQVYGVTGGVSPPSLYTLKFDSSGLRVFWSYDSPFPSPPYSKGSLISDGNRLYAYNAVVDPNTIRIVGRFTFAQGSVSSVYPERRSNKVYLLESVPYLTSLSRVWAADKSTYLQTGHLLIPIATDGLSKLQRWGSNGLAFRKFGGQGNGTSDDQVVFVRSSVATPVPPTIQITPASVDFGSQQHGTTSATTTIAIKNVGPADLLISKVEITGTDASQFAFKATPFPSGAQPNATVNVDITFSPTTSGAKTATLIITDNASGSPHTVPLTGTGTAPIIELSPTGLSFGSQALTKTSDPLILGIKNTGTAALTVTNVAIIGANPSDFAIPGTATPFAVAPGETRAIGVTFTPSAMGSRAAVLSITDNATGSPHTIPLSGTGTAPIIELSPTSLSFGSQALSKTTDPLILNVKNTGTAALTVTNVAIIGANASDFAIPGTATPFTVAPGETKPISVTFTPSGEGTRTANLQLTHNANNSIGAVSLTGNGVKIATTAQFSPGSLDFGSAPTGTPLAARYVTVMNTGYANLVINEIAITGPGAADFTFGTRPMPMSIGPFTMISIPVTANPKAVGLRTATLKFSDNATGTPHQVALSVTGKGTPAFSAVPSPVDFGKQNVGVASASLPVTISNPGTDNLVITALAFAGTNTADFTVTPATGLPITVAPGASTALTLKFTPAASGTRTATLRVTNNTTGSPNSISISGIGTIPVLTTAAPGDFGSVPTSTTSLSKTAVLTNTGTGPLTISAITITGTNAADFVIVTPPTLPAVIQPSASLNLGVTFTPGATGTRTASISVNDTAAGSPHVIALSGTGTPNGPAIAFNPPAVAFGNQQISQIKSAFLTVTNSGNQTLTITNIQVTGANSGDFGIAPILPANINAGGSTTFEIAFKPTATGTRSAQLTFTDNVSGGTQSVSLTGLGVSGQITAGPSSLVFADQPSGSQSAAKVVTVTNPGTQPATITSLQIGGINASSFGLVSPPALPASIAAGGTLALNVVFTPKTVASGLSSTLTIATTNAGSATVSLSGNGIQSSGARIGLNTTSLEFPATSINTVSASKPVVISNTGIGNVVVSSVTITGANASDFAFSGPTAPFTVWPQSSTVVSVTFKPTGSGTRNATLTLVDSAAGSPHTIMLSGVGK